MRLRRALSWALTWAAVISLAGCDALRDGPGQGRGRGPAELAAVDGEDADCELLVVRRGEAAELKEEKEPEDAEGFVYLMNQDRLLDQFRIDEEDEEACALAFGLQFGSGGPGGLAPAAFGAAIPASAIAIGAVTIGLGLAVGVVAGGGGGDDDSPVSTPSTP